MYYAKNVFYDTFEEIEVSKNQFSPPEFIIDFNNLQSKFRNRPGSREKMKMVMNLVEMRVLTAKIRPIALRGAELSF